VQLLTVEYESARHVQEVRWEGKPEHYGLAPTKLSFQPFRRPSANLVWNQHPLLALRLPVFNRKRPTRPTTSTTVAVIVTAIKAFLVFPAFDKPRLIKYIRNRQIRMTD